MDNNNNGNNSNSRNILENKTFLFCLFVLTLIITILSFLLFSKILIQLPKVYSTVPSDIFEQCYFHQSQYQIIISFSSFILGLNLSLILFIDIFNLFDRLNKFHELIYWNLFLVFGLYLTGVVVILMRDGHNLMYQCVNYNINLRKPNFGSMIFVLISFSFSIVVLFVGAFIYGWKNVQESISMKFYGNYYLGKIFWKYALNNRF